MKPLDQWKDRADYFEAGGARIAHWATINADEDKPWLTLIHGFPTSSWDWSGIWDKLEARFNLIALDMLGFGLSDKPSTIKYSILDQADLFEALLARLGVSETHILAHDYGDTVAQELLARHNARTLSFSIKSVCFLNGGLFPEQHRPLLIQKLGVSPVGALVGMVMTREKLRQSFDLIFGPQTKAADAEIDGHWSLINENRGRKIFHKLLQYIPERKEKQARWVGALKETHVPMRLINGGADPISGKHLYDYYREQVPNADAVLLEAIGHYPQTEAPQEVLDAFLGFHQRLGAIKC